MPAAFYERKISKFIFKLFKRDYIDKGINLFEKIRSLDDSYLIFDKNIETHRKKSKKGVVSYIVYQLANIKDGVGYFDVDSESWESKNHTINKLLNKYFFEICFLGESWVWYFVEYILSYIWLPNAFFDEEDEVEARKLLIFRYNKWDTYILQVLEKERMENYIKKNEAIILEYLKLRDKFAYITYDNISISYTEAWNKVLDEVSKSIKET